MKRKVWDTNRFLSQIPRSKRGWCHHCDAELVNTGKKCINCGSREPHRRMGIKDYRKIK